MLNNNVKYITRKKFLLWSGALLSAASLIKIWNPFGKSKPESSKFLTQDGELVEVDHTHLKTKGTKIYTSDLKDWIKK